MKTHILLLFVLGLFFFGCKDDDSLTIPEENINMRAKVDGVDWKGRANGISDGAIFRPVVGVGGAWTDGSSITITFVGDTLGTYDLTGLAIFNDRRGNTFFATSGSVTVSKFENNILSGTFEFIGADQAQVVPNVRITEGTFTDVEIR